MERHTYVYTPPCSLMSGRRMPLYMQRQLCRYTCSGIRAAMHETATVPQFTQRQLPLHTNGRTAANTPFSIKRDCSTQARCMGGGARPRLCNASADAPRLSHTRCTPCGIMGVPIFFGSPYSQILNGHVEQGHVLRRQGHTLREARLLFVPEPKQRIIHPQSRGRRQALAPALCSQDCQSTRETSALPSTCQACGVV